jgi:predicted ATPase/DNA-binding SARP family transcriptional activator
VEIGILGPLQVSGSEGTVALPGGRARVLLAVLAIRPDTVISADRLIDELWGESAPPTAGTKLQGLVSTLRKRIAADLIETHSGGYRLAVDPLVVDAQRFRRLVEQAGGSNLIERRELLGLALGLWRGSALEGFTYEPFAQTEITMLEDLRVSATEQRIDTDLALGRQAEVIPELRRLVSSHPLREHLTGQLMLALYRDGRQAEALRVFQDLRQLLAEELGIDPSPELQRLEEVVLNQDPALDRTETGSGEPETVTWLPERRRPATVVFVGLATAEDGADVEVSRVVIQHAYRVVADTIERHGGTVQGFLGDVVVAVFGVPTAHEDDALRAAKAVLALRRALAAEGPITFRIGINSGDIVVGDTRSQPSGATVAIASRLHQAARRGEILIGEATRRLLGGTAVIEPVSGEDAWGGLPPAWRLGDLTEARIQPTPTVGRDEEVARLRTLFQRVVVGRSALSVEVIGEAGIGKSRLARELTRALGDEALVLTGRCPAYGEGISFWPLRELLVQVVGGGGDRSLSGLGADLGISDTAIAQLGGAAGLHDYPGNPQQLFGAVREFFTALARRRPLVLVIEDLHWAQPTFIDLLDYLARTTDAPILILCLARSESAGSRPRDGRIERLVLAPLNSEDTESLVAARAGLWTLTSEMMARVVETVQGNPLFAEQTVAALKDDEELAIPPSVHALLTARLDRLGPGEEDLARSAAVLGTDFSAEAVAGLVPPAVRPFVGRYLRKLEEKGLVVRTQRQFLGDPGMAFGHVLIQAAAYRSLTRGDRARLHELAGEWIEEKSGGGLDELIGYHLEKSYADRTALGINDERTFVLRDRAGDRLATAGMSAYARFDVTAAENLLTRAKALMAPDHPRRYSVMRRLAETYPMMGRLADADAAFEELLEEVEDEYAERSVRLEQVRNQMIRGPDPLTLEQALGQAEAALLAYSAAGDERGMSQACYVLAHAHQLAGRVAELERVAWEGLAHARLADRREEVGAIWYVSAALVIGPTPIAEAIGLCKEMAAAHGHTHGGLLSDLGLLHAMGGEFETAREMLNAAHQDILERRGIRRALTHVGLRAGEVEILAGDRVAGEAKLRWALDLATQVGERDLVAQIASALAQVVSDRGDLSEAGSLAEHARERAPVEGVMAQALWRAATARVLTKRDDPTGAARLIREALGMVPDDLVSLRADLYRDLAFALTDPTEAEAAATVARSLYERKGHLVGVAELIHTSF